MKFKIIIIIIIIIGLLFIYFTNNNYERYENINTPFPIDVVYTWAGEKLSKDIRLSNNNELKYSLRSVFQFIPWVNHIYIIMNPPKTVPSWFNSKYSEKITVIDHYDTFDNKSYLPTTNSNSIETTIHNLHTLSEHFIYFNDDVFIGRPLLYTEFFTEDGKIVIYNELNNCKSMQKSGLKKINFRLPIYCGLSKHLPFPNKKSVINKFHDQYSDYINLVRNIKKRNMEGTDACEKINLYPWCQQQHTLLQKFAYDNDQAIIKQLEDSSLGYYSTHSPIKELYKISLNLPKFFCINDSYDFENINEKINLYEKINKFLESYYDKSLYEDY